MKPSSSFCASFFIHFGYFEPGREAVERLRGARQVEGHGDVVRRDRRAFKAPDDDLFQRVPLVPGHDGARPPLGVRSLRDIGAGRAERRLRNLLDAIEALAWLYAVH